MFCIARGTVAALALVAVASGVVPLASAPAQAPSRPAAAGTDTGAIATVRKLQHTYATAAMRRDSATLKRLEAPDAIMGGPDGTVSTGADDVKSVLSGALAIDSLTVDSLDIRPAGTAMVASVITTIVRGHAGTVDIAGSYRILDVWARRGGQWQIVAEQVTPMARRQ